MHHDAGMCTCAPHARRALRPGPQCSVSATLNRMVARPRLPGRRRSVVCRIQHILTSTGESSLSYVGHSQGTMIALEALASASSTAAADQPAAKINIAVLLAPVAFPRHTTSALLRTLARLDAPRIVARFGVSSFLPAGIGSVFAFSLVRPLLLDCHPPQYWPLHASPPLQMPSCILGLPNPGCRSLESIFRAELRYVITERVPSYSTKIV